MPKTLRRTPRVLNKRTDPIPGDAVYVGRPSPWGNPFKIGKDGNRKEVIEKFRVYVLTKTPHQREHWFRTLRGRDLVCWCAPLPCHADVLLEMANES